MRLLFLASLLLSGFFISCGVGHSDSSISDIGDESFYDAIEKGDVAKIKKMFKENPSLDLNALGPHLQTPLMLAVKSNRYDMVDLLFKLDPNIDPNVAVPGFPMTPFEQREMQGNGEIRGKSASENKKLRNAHFSRGSTAVLLCAFKPNHTSLSLLKLIVQKSRSKIDPNHADKYGTTLLSKASYYFPKSAKSRAEHHRFVMYILDTFDDIDVNQINTQNHSALTEAAYSASHSDNHLLITKMLKHPKYGQKFDVNHKGGANKLTARGWVERAKWPGWWYEQRTKDRKALIALLNARES